MLTPCPTASPSPTPARPAAGAPACAGLLEDHQAIEAHLVRLRALAVALAHAGLTATVRAEARAALAWFEGEARAHHLQEEREVFPALLGHADPARAEQAQRLIQEHSWLEAEWQQLAPALQAAANGQASFDPQVLRHGVEVFVQLYRDHMDVEEAFAYPAAWQGLATN